MVGLPTTTGARKIFLQYVFRGLFAVLGSLVSLVPGVETEPHLVLGIQTESPHFVSRIEAEPHLGVGIRGGIAGIVGNPGTVPVSCWQVQIN